jgi:hypothetical protein
VSDLTDLTVAAIRDGVRDGAFSAREVAEGFVANVEKGRASTPMSWRRPSTRWPRPTRPTAPAPKAR